MITKYSAGKKIILTLMALLLSSSLSANDTVDRAKLKSTMRDMLKSMELIQRGGFYANPKQMQAGVSSLKKHLALLDAKHAKTYLPQDEKYAYKFAVKREKMITMYANDIIESLKANNMDDALEDYSQILKQCSSCHLRIRK